MTILAVAIISLAAGFGLGRIKNAAKLSTARAELNRLEVGVSSEVKSVISAIRAKL
jgi:hypothetical protein